MPEGKDAPGCPPPEGGGRAAVAAKLAEEARGHPGYLMPAETWQEAELRRMQRAWTCGALGALVDALLFCMSERTSPPPWVAPAAAGAMTGIHDDALRGRSAHALPRHRANVVHRLRWDAVVYVQDVRRAWRIEDAQFLRMLRHDGADEDEIAEWLALARDQRLPELRRGFSPAEVRDDFDTAARLLSLTPAGGGAETVRRSYRLVEAERRSWPDMPSFYLPSDDALTMIGMEDLAGLRDGLLATDEWKMRRKRPR